MAKLYSNPNARRRTVRMAGRVSDYEPGGTFNRMPEAAAPSGLEGAGAGRTQHISWPLRERYSAGHLRNVEKFLPIIRRCRERLTRPPRRIPRKVLETIIVLNLK